MNPSTTNLEVLLLQRLGFDDAAFLGFVLLLTVGYCLRGVVWDKPDPHLYRWFEKPQSGSLGSKSEATRDIGLKLEQSVSYRTGLHQIQADMLMVEQTRSDILGLPIRYC